MELNNAMTKFVLISILWMNFVCMGSAEIDSLPHITEHPKSLIASRNNPATLKCSTANADRVQWFLDGRLLSTAETDDESHRIILPDNSLFFLRVTSGKRENDAGTYWCVAMNNRGAVRSRNATLVVSSLDDAFQLQENPSVKSRAGEKVVLRCRPPRGVPSPLVKWKHDGHIAVNNSRVYMVQSGDLVFEEVTESDNGKYVCVAHNDAGKRESRPTTLSVISTPWFKERPENLTAITGSTVELRCKARGSPFPSVTWRKIDGKIPINRRQILPDHTLQIGDLSASDSGEYVCEAKNEAGVSRSTAFLSVVAAPEVKEKLNDVLISVNKNLVLTCRIEGTPLPLIVWRLPSKDLPTHMIAGQTDRRSSVSNDSSVLRINEMQIEDMGPYMCWGISSGGGVTSRSNVIVVNALPPPLIGVRPKDLVVRLRSKVAFPCEAVSEAAEHTVTWWHQAAAHLEAKQILPSSKVSILPLGTLMIREITQADAGIYTCKVTSDAGQVEAEAILKVSDIAPKGNKHSSVPAPPSKPKIINVNSSSVTLSWLPNSRVALEPNQLYKIEYWRAPWQEWRLAKEEVSGETYTVLDLQPNTAHIFSVRAIDRFGEESFPSPWSDMVYTTDNKNHLTMDEERKAARKLNSPSVFLTSANAVSDDSVALAWKFLDPADTLVDGVTIYSATSKKITTQAVLSLSSTTYVVQGLEANTQHTFFVVPFFKKIEGAPSNSHTVVTHQKVLPVFPLGLTMETYPSGSSLVQWQPLSSRQVDGKITGYKISISYNNTTTIKETTNTFIETRNLMPGQIYSMKVAYVTDEGMGPWSTPQSFQVPVLVSPNHVVSNENPSIMYAPMHPLWLLYLLVPACLMLLVGTFMYTRHIRKKRVPSSPEPSTGAALYADTTMHTPHLINMYGEQKLWRPESDKDSSISSTRLLRPDHMANEYAEPRVRRTSDPTEPYATTALLAPASPRICASSPSWKYARCTDNSIQVNWGALIPPPPVAPPPADVPSHDGETCSSGTSTSEGRREYGSASSHYENGAASEQYEHPCDVASEHTYDVYTPPHLIRVDNAPYYLVQAGSVRGSGSDRYPSSQNNTH